MLDIARAFQEGGWSMWAVLAVAMVTHVGALVGVVVSFTKASRGTLFVLAGLGVVGVLLTLGVGWVGYSTGMSTAHDAVRFADPELRDSLLTEAEAEAGQNTKFGLVASAWPALATVIVGLRAVTRNT